MRTPHPAARHIADAAAACGIPVTVEHGEVVIFAAAHVCRMLSTLDVGVAGPAPLGDWSAGPWQALLIVAYEWKRHVGGSYDATQESSWTRVDDSTLVDFWIAAWARSAVVHVREKAIEKLSSGAVPIRNTKLDSGTPDEKCREPAYSAALVAAVRRMPGWNYDELLVSLDKFRAFYSRWAGMTLEAGLASRLSINAEGDPLPEDERPTRQQVTGVETEGNSGCRARMPPLLGRVRP